MFCCTRICAYDQFLTARTVLDFVYRILTGEGFLFDNIFRLSGSDLLDALQKLDPCTKRSKRLDLFRIRTKLEIFDPEFLAFRDKAVDFLGTKSLEPSSWIRFFYLMQDVEIGNNYHQSIAADLKEGYSTTIVNSGCSTQSTMEKRTNEPSFGNSTRMCLFAG